jgi:diguanylate cyclase (GGDEF)-like protein
VTTTAATRILVVDDDPGTARLVREWYRGQPFRILEAADGEEGIRVALSERPDIILMDLVMPRTNGFDAARRLKSDPATSGIPVILVSAQRETKSKRDGFDAGADDYVTKPFEFEEVDARIRAMLRKRELYLTLESRNQELKATNEQLEELATVDELTGLANYRVFRKRLQDEWIRAARYGQPLSLVMLDLDDFKQVNDTLGHPAGDRVLREFAMLVAGGARATDLPARYGGEEFAIILPHTEGERAVRVAERVRAAVADFAFLDGETPLKVTVSAGVATHPSAAGVQSADEFLKVADRALYAAKNGGKNRVVVDGDKAPA